MIREEISKADSNSEGDLTILTQQFNEFKTSQLIINTALRKDVNELLESVANLWAFITNINERISNHGL